MKPKDHSIICPMTSLQSFDGSHPCQEDGCAWWDCKMERCSIFSVAQELADKHTEILRDT